MNKMRNSKRSLRCWKRGLRKILVSVPIALTGFLLVSCYNQQEIIRQPTVQVVKTHSIDTCFVFRTDTAFVWETDTLRIETLIRDTVIRQRIETKPIIIRDTVTQTVPAKPIYKEHSEKEHTLCEMIIGVCAWLLLCMFFLWRMIKRVERK